MNNIIKFRILIFSILLIVCNSIIYGRDRVPYELKRNADELMVQKSSQAYIQGHYLQCIAYADSLYEVYGFADYEICHANTLVFAYAAASCYNLSKYNYTETDYSSLHFLREAYLYYKHTIYYLKRYLLNREINEYTDFTFFLNYCKELDLLSIGNLAAIEYIKAISFYLKDWAIKKELKRLNRTSKLLQKAFTNKILANKSIARADLPTYNTLQLLEIFNVLMNTKETDFKEVATSFVSNYITELQNIVPSLGLLDDNKVAYMTVRNNFRRFAQAVSVMAHENMIEREIAVDTYLKFLNFSNFVNGSQEFSELTTWKKIKNCLEPGEYVFIFYEGPINSGSFCHYSEHNMTRFYAYVIGWDMDGISILNRKLNTVISEEDFEKWCTNFWPGMECAYILGTEHMKTLDCAGINQNIHMIHSVNSLLKNKKQSSYKIKFIGNLIYSNDTTHSQNDDTENKRGIGMYKPLSGSKQEIDFLTDYMSKDDIKIIEKKYAKKSRVLEIGDENILHIATHGEIDNAKLNLLNNINPYDGMTGTNIFKSCYMILSSFYDYYDYYYLYNHTGNNETIISGYDIVNHDFSNLDLVYLDCCKTAYAKNLYGSTFSMAEAFYIAGAKNIIAYLEPVDDKIAAKFSELFYTNLFNGLSIHDSFYNAKRKIQDIKPNLQIILWE